MEKMQCPEGALTPRVLFCAEGLHRGSLDSQLQSCSEMHECSILHVDEKIIRKHNIDFLQMHMYACIHFSGNTSHMFPPNRTEAAHLVFLCELTYFANDTCYQGICTRSTQSFFPLASHTGEVPLSRSMQ